MELRDERVNTPLRVNATDISGNGCYVETVMPLPIGTALRVDLWMGEERISPSAVVRTRDPGVGMGIEFTGMPEESKKRFQAHLDKMDPGVCVRARKSGIVQRLAHRCAAASRVKSATIRSFEPSNHRTEKASSRT